MTLILFHYVQIFLINIIEISSSSMPEDNETLVRKTSGAKQVPTLKFLVGLRFRPSNIVKLLLFLKSKILISNFFKWRNLGSLDYAVTFS